MSVLMPITNLMNTAMKKTRIKFASQTLYEDQVPTDLYVEEDRILSRSGNRITEWPRDPRSTEIIGGCRFYPDLGFMEGWEVEIPPTRGIDGLNKKRERRKSGRKNYNLNRRALSRSVDHPSVNQPMLDLEGRTSSDPSSTSSLVSSIENKMNEAVNLQRILHCHMIYFRVVEKKVLECLTNSILTPSKKSLENLNYLREDLKVFLNKLESFYYAQEDNISELETSEQFQDILKCVGNLESIFEQLDDSEIPALLEMTVEKKNETALCSILGLREEVGEYLSNLSADIRSHQTDEQWIQDFIEQKNSELENVEIEESTFEFLGFTPVKAKSLCELIAENPYIAHQTVAHWARDHIEQQFKYNILLAGQRKEDRHITTKCDEEFTITTSDSIDVDAFKTLLLAKEMLAKVPWLTNYLAQEEAPIESIKFWFHGTDHISAQMIVKEGIDVEKSKKGRDFSDGKGFYLSTSYEMAHMWPSSRIKKTTTAVIVFKAQPDLFSKSEGKSFLEDQDDEQWREIVSFFRKGKMGCSVEKRRAYKKLKYIFGPMSGDGYKVCMISVRLLILIFFTMFCTSFLSLSLSLSIQALLCDFIPFYNKRMFF